MLASFPKTIPFRQLISKHFSLPVVQALPLLSYQLQILLVILGQNGSFECLSEVFELIDAAGKLNILLNVVILVQCCSLAHVLLMAIQPELFHRLFAESLVKAQVRNWANDRLDQDLAAAGLGGSSRHPVDLYVSTVKILQSQRIRIIIMLRHCTLAGNAIVLWLLIHEWILIKSVVHASTQEVLASEVVDLRSRP